MTGRPLAIKISVCRAFIAPGYLVREPEIPPDLAKKPGRNGSPKLQRVPGSRGRFTTPGCLWRVGAMITPDQSKHIRTIHRDYGKTVPTTIRPYGVDQAVAVLTLRSSTTLSVPSFSTRSTFTCSSERVSSLMPVNCAQMGSSLCPRSTSTATWTRFGRP